MNENQDQTPQENPDQSASDTASWTPDQVQKAVQERKPGVYLVEVVVVQSALIEVEVEAEGPVQAMRIAERNSRDGKYEDLVSGVCWERDKQMDEANSVPVEPIRPLPQSAETAADAPKE